MPITLKRRQDGLIPEGETVPLRITNTAPSTKFGPSIMVEGVVIDGEYAGYYITDFLNVSTNKDTGVLYVSPKGKLSDLLQAELTDEEYNNLADQLALPETTDDKCLEIIAKALKNAKDRRFTARVRQTDPNDPKVKEVSNKLLQDAIFPYRTPEKKAQTKALVANTEAELDELQYDEE